MHEPPNELLRAWQVRDWLIPLFPNSFLEEFLLTEKKVIFVKTPWAKPWYRKSQIKQAIRDIEPLRNVVGPTIPPAKLPAWIGRRAALEHLGIPGKELDSWVILGLVKAQQGKPWHEPRYFGLDLEKIITG